MLKSLVQKYAQKQPNENQIVDVKLKGKVHKLKSNKIGKRLLKIKWKCFKVLKTYESQNQSIWILECLGKSEKQNSSSNTSRDKAQTRHI